MALRPITPMVVIFITPKCINSQLTFFLLVLLLGSTHIIGYVLKPTNSATACIIFPFIFRYGLRNILHYKHVDYDKKKGDENKSERTTP